MREIFEKKEATPLALGWKTAFFFCSVSEDY